MLYNPLALQVRLSQDDYDGVRSALRGVSNESFKQFKVIVILEIIPEAWLVRVRGLLAESCLLLVYLLFLSWLSRCKPAAKGA